MWVANALLIRLGSDAIDFVPPNQPYIPATIFATTIGVAIIVATIIIAVLVQFFLNVP